MVFNANNVAAVHPDTGQPLTGAAFQISGGVAASLAGWQVAQAQAVINNIGGAGCAGVGPFNVGAGFYWSGGTRLTCDLGRYEIHLPDNPFDGVSASGPVGGATIMASATPTATGDVLTTFEVAEGEGMLGVQAFSPVGAPKVKIIAPDGTEFTGDDDDLTDGFAGSMADHDQFAMILEPKPGQWKVVELEGSATVKEVSTYFPLPEVEVEAEVVEIGGKYSLDFHIKDIPGQQVQFFEREPGSAGMRGIGTAASPRGPLTPKPALFEQAIHRVLPAERETMTKAQATMISETTDEVEFTPSGPQAGGPREIVAVILQDGFVREQIVVDTYTAPPASKAGAADVEVTETAGGAKVTWKAPDNGGREITSYRVSSGVGEPVVVDGDARSADLTIPYMTVGDEVPVIVQAFTELGWGERGWTTFRATQETDGGGGSPDPEPGPDSGPKPTPRPSPGQGGGTGAGDGTSGPSTPSQGADDVDGAGDAAPDADRAPAAGSDGPDAPDDSADQTTASDEPEASGRLARVLAVVAAALAIAAGVLWLAARRRRSG